MHRTENIPPTALFGQRDGELDGGELRGCITDALHLPSDVDPVINMAETVDIFGKNRVGCCERIGDIPDNLVVWQVRQSGWCSRLGHGALMHAPG